MAFVASQIAVWMIIAFVVGIFVGWLANSRRQARTTVRSSGRRRYR